MPPTVISLLCLLLLPLGGPSTDSSTKIDFKNFTYPWNHHLEDDVPMSWRWRAVSYLNSSISVKDGEHLSAEDDGTYVTLAVDNVIWGDLDGDGKPEAAVKLTYHSGGTAH